MLRNHFYLMRHIYKASPTRLFLHTLMRMVSLSFGAFYSLVLFRYIINAPQNGRTFGDVMWFLLLFLALDLVNGAVKCAYQRLYRPGSDRRIEQYFQTLIYEQSARVDIACYEDPAFYDSFVKAAENVQQKALQALELIANTIALIWTLCLTAGFALWVEPGVLVICLLPAAAVFWLDRKRSSRAFALQMDSVPLQRQADYVQRTVYLKEHAKEMRLYPVFGRLKKDYDAALKRLREIAGAHGKWIALWRFLSEFAMQVWLFTSLNGYIVYRYATAQAFTLGDFASLTGAAINFCHFLEDLSDNYTALHQLALYAGNLKTFLEKQPQIHSGKMQAPPVEEIRLEGVCFAYPGTEKETLHDISLTWKKGEKLALVGHNGAGKSTLVKLLLRLYEPTRGRILCNGQDISEFTLESWRAVFATCLQNAPLFAATVGENVMMDCVEKEDEETIREALERAGAEEMVKAWPKGLRTMLTREFDPDGVSLSGGQAQKLSLARLFASDAPIYVVDEPSSALDPAGEHALFESLLGAAQQKTVLFISHRLSSATMADTICYLEAGQIAEKGSHTELMQKNGAYAAMFRAQAERYAEGADVL